MWRAPLASARWRSFWVLALFWPDHKPMRACPLAKTQKSSPSIAILFLSMLQPVSRVLLMVGHDPDECYGGKNSAGFRQYGTSFAMIFPWWQRWEIPKIKVGIS